MTGLRRLFGYTFWILFIVQLFGVQTAELIHKGDVQEEKCRTLEDLSKFRPQEKVNLSQYGGWKKKKFNRTGFFHAFKDYERWWLVDPEGYAFFSLGVNSVNLGNNCLLYTSDAADE